MRRRIVAVVGVLCLALAVLPAQAGHRGDEDRKGLKAMGHSFEPTTFTNLDFFTDIAFWRNKAYQGRWNGFRILDIRNLRRPRELTDVACGSAQGDVSVYRGLLFRSIDAPHTGTECDATPVEEGGGFEGIQIFDVSDPANTTAADLLHTVATDCGSHTHTLVPDPRHDRVLLYIGSSGGAAYPATSFGNECLGEAHSKFDIVEVPLDDPTSASVIGAATLGPAGAPISSQCHDIGVLMGEDLAVCAGTPESTLHDISNPAQPVFLRSFAHPDVAGWHSGAFSWDGEVVALGWEPGGGVNPECEATDPDTFKSIFFYDMRTSELLGTWVLPHDQSAEENCTIHNYNIVPIRGRDVLVHGSYMAGTGVVDFSDPANAKELAYVDPPPLDPDDHPFPAGGAWGTYWYRGFMYETEITEGLNIWRFNKFRKLRRNAARLPYLNPQTQTGF